MPISAHRAFPAVVALWFAALLGIGSLILPQSLYVNMGLGGLDEAGRPMVGMTTRLVIAVALAAVGVVMGLLLARRVASGNSVAEPAKPSGPLVARQPIAARSELGSDSLDEPVDEQDAPARPPYLGRRRALSLADESGPSEFLDHAPVPGASEDAGDDAGDDGDEADFDALELTELADEDESPLPLANDELPIEDSPAPAETAQPLAFADDAFVDDALSEDAEIEEPDFDAAFLHDTRGQEQATAEPEPELPAEDGPDMTESFAPRSDYNPFADFDPPEHTDLDAPSQSAQAHSVEEPAEPAAAERDLPAIATKPLADMGLVELVERLAFALENRSAADLAPQPAQDANTPMVFRRPEKDAAPAQPQPASEEAALPERTPFNPFGQPLDLDEEDEDGYGEDDDGPLALDLSDYMKRAGVARAEAEFEADAENESIAAESQDAYSSLLSMRSSLGGGGDFVRIDEADEEDEHPRQVVVFPGQEKGAAFPASDGPVREGDTASAYENMDSGDFTPRKFDAPVGSAQPKPASAVPNDTERALREALEKLQRMSGGN